MTDLILKYNLLNDSSKSEVIDFVEFLLDKQKHKKTDAISDYKKKILQVSIWSESDIESFHSDKNLFGNWNVDQW